ncbi:MAG: hypothetical protein HFJ37_04290 [Clostridia bacterium]|nr:hypothetical protein [Clostridia bacterium]
MIEKSIFTKEEIKKEILDRYDIKVETIEVIDKGTASIYKIGSKNKNYIMKEIQSKYSEKDVLNEINSIEYLKQHSDVPLPQYIKCKDGNSHFVFKQKVVVLQEFIEGQVCKKNEGDYIQLMESAEYLAKIIKGLENYTANKTIKIEDWYSKNEFEKADNKYNKIIENAKGTRFEQIIKEDITFKKNLLKELRERLDFSEISKITYKTSHGDYSSLQFIYDDKGKIKVVLDFIKVKELPIIWEIARSYSYIDKEAREGKINIKNLVDYTKEFTKITKLNKYDFKYLPYVYLIQLARSTFGYEEYYNNVNNKEEQLEFAFYRTRICRDLYEKAEEISEELLKIEGD